MARKAVTEENTKKVSKGVSLKPSMWRLLTLVSRHRQDIGESRYMVSAIISDILDGREATLRKEIK